MFINVRSRARRFGVPFDLDSTDIVIPKRCPLLDIPLIRGTKIIHAGSPSLDKIEPRKGYSKGNVQVISFKANAMKQNATLEEFELMARNWRRLVHGKDSN